MWTPQLASNGGLGSPLLDWFAIFINCQFSEPPSLPLTISLSQQVPIYFSGGMASRANLYYRLLINWTNSQVQNPASRHSAFTFPHTLPWERSLLNAEVRIREESTIPCLQSQLYEPRKSRHTDSVAGMQSIPDAGPYLGPLPGSPTWVSPHPIFTCPCYSPRAGSLRSVCHPWYAPRRNIPRGIQGLG